MKKIHVMVLLVLLMSLASCTQKEVEEANDYMPPVVEDVTPEESNMDEQGSMEEESSESSDEAMMEGDTMIEDNTMTEGNGANTVDALATLKEFEMTSFTEIIDGAYFPQFSMKEIEVNQGDTVRISITTTAGVHDFNIDEFAVSTETPLDETVVVEFVADTAGTFEYYCSKPGHRANGHWGTLIVR